MFSREQALVNRTSSDSVTRPERYLALRDTAAEAPIGKAAVDGLAERAISERQPDRAAAIVGQGLRRDVLQFLEMHDRDNGGAVGGQQSPRVGVEQRQFGADIPVAAPRHQAMRDAALQNGKAQRLLF